MRTCLFFFSLLCCLSLSAEVFLTENGDIKYLGKINESNNNMVKTLYDKAATKPERLIISSSGGAVDYGIQLGEWVFDNQLDIEVGDYCISSCANYVFLAAKVKILRKNSLLGWHGGLLQRSDVPFSDHAYLKHVSALTTQCDFKLFRKKYDSKLVFSFSNTFSNLSRRECQLVRRSGVDYSIMIAGQYQQYYQNSSYVDFWSYDIGALTYLGVENIQLKEGMWQPPTGINGKKVFYFSVDDLSAINNAAQKTECNNIRFQYSGSRYPCVEHW